MKKQDAIDTITELGGLFEAAEKKVALTEFLDFMKKARKGKDGVVRNQICSDKHHMFTFELRQAALALSVAFDPVMIPDPRPVLPFHQD